LPKDPNERALIEYYLAQEAAQLDSGTFVFERFEEAVESYGWTAEQREYVKTNTRGVTKHPPLIQQYLKDREMLAEKGWFDITKQFVEMPIFNIPEGDYKAYRNVPAVSQDRWLATRPELEAALGAASDRKRQILEREKDINVLMALVKWGYVTKLSNAAYDRWTAELARRQRQQ
jgi:hypothetical protein